MPLSPKRSGLDVIYITATHNSLATTNHMAPVNHMGVRRCNPTTYPEGKELALALRTPSVEICRFVLLMLFLVMNSTLLLIASSGKWSERAGVARCNS